jgi:hypothetical protein
MMSFDAPMRAAAGALKSPARASFCCRNRGIIRPIPIPISIRGVRETQSAMDVLEIRDRYGLSLPPLHVHCLLDPTAPIHEACEFLLLVSEHDLLDFENVNKRELGNWELVGFPVPTSPACTPSTRYR